MANNNYTIRIYKAPVPGTGIDRKYHIGLELLNDAGTVIDQINGFAVKADGTIDDSAPGGIMTSFFSAILGTTTGDTLQFYPGNANDIDPRNPNGPVTFAPGVTANARRWAGAIDSFQDFSLPQSDAMARWNAGLSAASQMNALNKPYVLDPMLGDTANSGSITTILRLMGLPYKSDFIQRDTPGTSIDLLPNVPVNPAFKQLSSNGIELPYGNTPAAGRSAVVVVDAPYSDVGLPLSYQVMSKIETDLYRTRAESTADYRSSGDRKAMINFGEKTSAPVLSDREDDNQSGLSDDTLPTAILNRYAMNILAEFPYGGDGDRATPRRWTTKKTTNQDDDVIVGGANILRRNGTSTAGMMLETGLDLAGFDGERTVAGDMSSAGALLRGYAGAPPAFGPRFSVSTTGPEAAGGADWEWLSGPNSGALSDPTEGTEWGGARSVGRAVMGMPPDAAPDVHTSHDATASGVMPPLTLAIDDLTLDRVVRGYIDRACSGGASGSQRPDPTLRLMPAGARGY